MSKNLSGAFFTTKSLNGENEVDINNLIAESAQIDDLSCSQLEIGTLNVIAKFGSVDNSINLLEQSIDDLSSNLDISCANIDVSLNANINNLTATGTKDFTTGLLNLGSTIMNSNIVGNSHNIAGLNKITASEGNIIDLSCANLDVSLNANFDDITATGTKDFTTGLLQMGSTIMNSNIVGNNHNIAGLNNITSSEGTIDTLTNTNFNTIDISCRHLHIENEFSNARYITFEDDYSRDIASFTGKLISGVNTDAIDLSMIGFSDSGNKEILLSTDPDTNSYIDVANFGIGTKTPTTKFEVNGNIKGTDLTITNDITCNNDITCDNDLDVDGIATFKDVVVSDTGTTGGSIDLTGELTINTPAFYGGTSGLKVNNTSYFNANVGIGIDSASNPLHIYESVGSGSIDNASTGALVLEHGNTDGLSRILFKSANGTTDFGAIQFNSSINAGEENCVLSIVSGNDGGTQDQIRFRTNEVNRMFIMGNGNIGINEASPTAKLHITNDSDNNRSGLDYLFKNTELFIQNKPDTTSGTLEKRRIVVETSSLNVKYKYATHLGTGNTESLEIVDGNMKRTGADGIRPENPDYKGFRLLGRCENVGDNNNEEIIVLTGFGNNSTSSTSTFRFRYNGNMEISGTLTQSSSRKLKENIIDANTNNLISDFQKLKWYNYNYKKDAEKVKQLGIIADDLINIYPLACEENTIKDDDNNKTNETYTSVKYDVIYRKCCMVVQELIKENETLKTRLDDLESRLSALEII